MRLKSVLGALAPLFFVGCYTQLATINYAPPPEMVTTQIDSATGETVKVIRQVDTIVSKKNEICVWERDFTGYPSLKCYTTYFPRSWVTYANTPWWYRNDPYWYDYNYCPRYYYYDRSCGCCRYIDSHSYPYWGGKHNRPYPSQNDKPASYSPSSSRSQGVPKYGSPALPSTGIQSVPLSKVPEAAPQKQSIIIRPSGRSSGVPSGGVNPVESNYRIESPAKIVAPPMEQERKPSEQVPVRRGRSAGVPGGGARAVDD